MGVLVFLSFFQLLLADNNPTLVNYLEEYKDIAIAEMNRTGIPASIKLAQAMLESDFGRSNLAGKANNHFGIKCGNDWEGKGFYIEDDDYARDGQLMKSCFRVFDRAEDSFVAHSEFLKDPKKEYRYGSLFQLATDDYVSWAYGLKAAGYATDPAYPQKLITIIEKYELHRYDQKIGSPVKEEIFAKAETNESSANKSPSNRILIAGDGESEGRSRPAKRVDIKVTNHSKFVLPWSNETATQLADRVGIPIDDITGFNDHIDYPHETLPNGVPVFLEAKSRDYEGPVFQHKVEKGETLELISQLYGIRLRTLQHLNRMDRKELPLEGQKINLKERVDKKPKTSKKTRSKFIF